MGETAPTLAFDMSLARKKDLVPHETTGQQVRRLRLARGLTQAELGKAVGLSQRMVAYYEAQGGVPSAELLRKFADALDVSTDALLGRTATRRESPEPQINLRLWRRVRRIEELPSHDRKTILKMIDAMANQAGNRKVG